MNDFLGPDTIKVIFFPMHNVAKEDRLPIWMQKVILVAEVFFDLLILPVVLRFAIHLVDRTIHWVKNGEENARLDQLATDNYKASYEDSPFYNLSLQDLKDGNYNRDEPYLKAEITALNYVHNSFEIYDSANAVPTEFLVNWSNHLNNHCPMAGTIINDINNIVNNR